MKKVFFIVLFAIVLCSAFAACSNSNNVQNNKPVETTSDYGQSLNSADTNDSDASEQNSTEKDYSNNALSDEKDYSNNALSDEKDYSSNALSDEKQSVEGSNLGTTNKDNTETDNSSNEDIIKNETTTSNNKTDVSDSENESPKIETDNNQIDIDNIIGGNYF